MSKFLKLSFIIIVLFTSCKTVKYADLQDGIYADIQTNKGDILLKLYADKTPMTVANFVSLAEGTNKKVVDSLKGKKYYNGTIFHRVIANFMIQGGDPTGTGRGNPGYKFADEFPRDSSDGLIYKHTEAGVLSMANSGKATNGSQFFITHKATPWLDGKHTVFGKVIKGQNVVDSIAKGDKINALEIIRLGKKAKNFDTESVFKQGEIRQKGLEKENLDRQEKIKKAFLEKMNISKAIKTNSGLKILQLKKGTGKKVNPAQKVAITATFYTATGRLLFSNVDKKPMELIINKKALVAGLKEGLLTMREGEKVRLFIPYYIGYGEKGGGSIPPKSDLVFEVEVLKVGE